MPAKERIIPWLIRRLAMLAILFSVLFLALGLFFKDRLIFHPVSESYGTPPNYSLPFEERWLTTAGGDSVRAWRILRRTGSESKTTILLFQGNSGNMTMMLDRMSAFHFLGFEVFSVDYPGYGPSPGRPSEEALYQSAAALRQWAAETGADAGQIIAYGFSLGGGVASYLAAEKKAAALILDSTFTKLRDVPGDQLPFLRPYLYLILGRAFDTEGRLSRDITCPLLVIHAPGDDVVPYKLGQRNFQQYRHQKKMASGTGDHMGFLLNQKLYLSDIKNLADSLTEESEGEATPNPSSLAPTESMRRQL